MMKTIASVITKKRNLSCGFFGFSGQLFLILFFSILSFSCKKNSQPSDPSIITFNVEEKYPLKTIDIHDVADVEYLLLESKNDSLYTNVVYITENYITTMNFSDGSFVFFNRQGRPVSKFGKFGQGPEEYLPFWIQIYDEEKDDFYVFSYPDKIQVYNREGEYKKTLPLPDNSGKVQIDAIYNYDDSYLLCHNKMPHDPPYFLLSKADATIKKLAYPYSPHRIDFRIRKADDTGYFLTIQFDYCYAIKKGQNYMLTDLSPDTIFEFTLKQELIPTFVRTPSMDKKRTPVSLSGFLSASHYSFFSLQEIAYDFNTRKSGIKKGFAYDKEKEEFYEVKMMNKDYEGQELILTPDRFVSRNLSELSSSPHTGIELLYVDKLKEANSKGQLSGDLKAVVERMTDDDQFILMILKFRED